MNKTLIHVPNMKRKVATPLTWISLAILSIRLFHTLGEVD